MKRTNLKAIILDCCPGVDGLEEAYVAARTSVPETSMARLLANTFIYPTMAVINALQNAQLNRFIQDLRAFINDSITFRTDPKKTSCMSNPRRMPWSNGTMWNLLENALYSKVGV